MKVFVLIAAVFLCKWNSTIVNQWRIMFDVNTLTTAYFKRQICIHTISDVIDREGYDHGFLYWKANIESHGYDIMIFDVVLWQDNGDNEDIEQKYWRCCDIGQKRLLYDIGQNHEIYVIAMLAFPNVCPLSFIGYSDILDDLLERNIEWFVQNNFYFQWYRKTNT